MTIGQNCKRVYIAGPMTGIADHNFPAFNSVAKELRDMGYYVLNPAENDGGSKKWLPKDYMQVDINYVLMSDILVVLSGWENSPGARLEVLIAHTLGKTIYTPPIDGYFISIVDPGVGTYAFDELEEAQAEAQTLRDMLAACEKDVAAWKESAERLDREKADLRDNLMAELENGARRTIASKDAEAQRWKEGAVGNDE